MIYAEWRKPENHIKPLFLLVLIDPTLLRAARQIYRAYCEAHPSQTKRPTGVAVNQLNYQGKVLFSSQPVLLPQECFIPLSQIESEISKVKLSANQFWILNFGLDGSLFPEFPCCLYEYSLDGKRVNLFMDTLIASLTAVIVFALGASIGSFINVVVYRLPAGLSIIWPRSRCPHCLHQLGNQENVPVLGWLWLKGRCRHCKSPISVRYPLVEAATGLLFLLIFWNFELSIIKILGYWTLCSWLLALSLIDLDTMTLPNPLTKSGLVIGLVLQIFVGFFLQAGWVGAINQLMSGIVGAVLGLWIFDAIIVVGSIVFGQAAMGGGDAKLAAMLGAWLGWKYLLLTAFLACALGAFVGGGAIALGLLNRRQPMPFGPFLALGAVVTIFVGEAILSTYLQFVFPPT